MDDGLGTLIHLAANLRSLGGFFLTHSHFCLGFSAWESIAQVVCVSGRSSEDGQELATGGSVLRSCFAKQSFHGLKIILKP